VKFAVRFPVTYSFYLGQHRSDKVTYFLVAKLRSVDFFFPLVTPAVKRGRLYGQPHRGRTALGTLTISQTVPANRSIMAFCVVSGFARSNLVGGFDAIAADVASRCSSLRGLPPQ
jgi:hypothetical protein